MAGIETVEVYVDADQMTEPHLMGTLHCQLSGRGELFSFRYDKTWIARAEAFWFRQLDLAPFDGLNWPHLEACDLSFRVGLGGRSP